MRANISLNNAPPPVELVPGIADPLAYGIQREWGTFQITTEADELYGLTPRVETDPRPEPFAAFATQRDQDTPAADRPNVHILLATPNQAGGGIEAMSQSTSVRTFFTRKSLQVVVATSVEKDTADLAAGMEMADLATMIGVDDLEEIEIEGPSGETMPASDVRRLLALSKTVSAIAKSSDATITDALPMWMRQDYNANFLRRVRHAGYKIGGGALALEGLKAGLEVPASYVDAPLVMLVLGGVLGYRAFRNYLLSASARESAANRYADQVGHAVGQAIVEAYIPRLGPAPNIVDEEA